MPYFYLPPNEIKFPPAHFADLDGLLAQGGDISTEWLIEGYISGAYLWSSPLEPLKWWSPDPRVILFTKDLDIKGYTKQLMEEELYEYKNGAVGFEICMDLCERVENRKEMYPGWITGQYKNVYKELFELGYVRYSLIRKSKETVACAFGTQIQDAFFTEYVSSEIPKFAGLALASLAQELKSNGVIFMDMDKETNLTADFDYTEIPRMEYLDLLKNCLNYHE